jgi:hypothetical protein
MDNLFLNENGFKYNSETDEWERYTIDGKLLMWRKPGSRSIWVLSYEDKETFIYEIRRGHKEEVLAGIKEFDRDLKLKELLG